MKLNNILVGLRDEWNDPLSMFKGLVTIAGIFVAFILTILFIQYIGPYFISKDYIIFMLSILVPTILLIITMTIIGIYKALKYFNERGVAAKQKTFDILNKNDPSQHDPKWLR